MVIYLIRHRETGKAYVGQTRRKLEVRFLGHQTCARDPKKRSIQLISRAIHCHGWDAFDTSVLQECESLEELNLAEQQWIAELNTLSPAGYNLTTGGGCKAAFSLESIAKLSRSKMGNDIGVEGRARISEHHKANPDPNFIGCQLGRARSEAFRQNLRRQKSGELAPLAKLTWGQVDEIRDSYLNGESQTSIAKRFSTTQANISRIVLHQIWKNEARPTECQR